MSTEGMLEIVELNSGEVVLRRADSEGEALMKIVFSDETKVFLGKSKVEICQAMFNAGVQLANELTDEVAPGHSNLDNKDSPRILH